MDEIYLTTDEVADKLGVMPRTVRAWLRDGELVGTLLGRKAGYRIAQRDFEAFMKSRTAVVRGREALHRPGKTEADNHRLSA